MSIDEMIEWQKAFKKTYSGIADTVCAETIDALQELKRLKGLNHQNFYFTFGSDVRFPYQNTYLIVKAENETEAAKKFRAKYPDREPDCLGNTIPVLNCSFVYSEKEWDKVLKTCSSYKEPAEVIE